MIESFSYHTVALNAHVMVFLSCILKRKYVGVFLFIVLVVFLITN